MVVENRIVTDLLRLGVRPGGVLLVHASLKSLGRVKGGAESVIQALLQAIGPNGTLLLPALSYATVDAKQPCFDLLHTPVCVGALPEYFRQLPGVIRSIHPTHSVCAYGKLARELTEKHHFDTTPCGRYSPFRLLPDYRGQILMLGCGFAPNTSIHAIEEVANVPYLLQKEAILYQIIQADGRKSQMRVRRHNFSGHYRQRYDRLAALLPADALSNGKVLEATAHLLEAPLMWETALRQLAEAPFYFVDAWQ